MAASPREVSDVGISGIQIYYPCNMVNQEELEQFDNVSSGKYTVGLGQQQMGFCADNEDVVSLALTVTKKLLDEYKIDPNSIGFLEVGTETIIDKSKSVKTELMTLFPDNSDIQGVDVKNACYGGTQALFHAVDWVYANYATEQRNAIAVLADIAVYEPGPARCTGGAGAIAVLITPNACIPLERGLRGTHMTPSWDFYKPIGKDVSEYPKVDGPVSLESYMSCLVQCYETYRSKSLRITGNDECLQSYSSLMFHCPFTKMVQKGLSRLAHIDYGRKKYSSVEYEKLSGDKPVRPEDKEVARILCAASKELWDQKTSNNLEINRRIGNMYTPSLLAQLVVHLSRRVRNPLNRILLFSYGSGSASSMFSVKVNYEDSRLEHLERVCEAAISSLDDRVAFSPQRYTEALEMRERFLVANVPVVPESLKQEDFKLFSGTFFLTQVDKMYRRKYATSSSCNNGHINGVINGSV